MEGKESVYSQAVRGLSETTSLTDTSSMSPMEKNYHFAMGCNGWFLLEDGEWDFYPNIFKSLQEDFANQETSFFGPNEKSVFFGTLEGERQRIPQSLNQDDVLRVVERYRGIDENYAARIAFLLGGIARHLQSPPLYRPLGSIMDSVAYTARMTNLGGKKSGEAVASAIAMYIISGGSTGDDNHFKGQIYHMANAVEEDPVIIQETRDLGLSQVARLQNFRENGRKFPKISTELDAFEGFPTVGAEFHFLPEEHGGNVNFWQRLALLNISQYQKLSHIQLSRNDLGVIEVRMNPSVYPVTVANWSHMKELLPELKKAYFTVTLNRERDGDFSWENGDQDIIKYLHKLGLLSYAGMFTDIPNSDRAQINLGAAYLGQTIKVHNGEYSFTGYWGGDKGKDGQIGIYTGFGDNMYELAYYLSMVLAEPKILDSLNRRLFNDICTLRDALTTDANDRQQIFSQIQNCVENNEKLTKIYHAGNKILSAFHS